MGQESEADARRAEDENFLAGKPKGLLTNTGPTDRVWGRPESTQRLTSTEATKSLQDIEKKDSLIVQAAVRNAVSLAVKHLAGRDPTTATHADMNFENVVWEMMQKEFTKGPDYSGGKA